MSAHSATSSLPCRGLRVVEVARGVSELGLGMAGGVPGMLLAALGAQVTRVVDPSSAGIDHDVTWGRVWHRAKRIVVAQDERAVAKLARTADLVLVYGDESLVEDVGLGQADLAAANPSLVYVRCRPSRTAAGTMADYGLLVEARTGFCTQLAGHRPGPIFDDLKAPAVGTALIMAASALALLTRRATSGRGGWADTSLYDGMLAQLGVMVGRSQTAADPIENYWKLGSTFPNFLYRCADGELLQVWFGGKGMYAALLAVLGDEPSAGGYYAEQTNGLLNERAVRWRQTFATRTRDEWIPALRAAGVAAEPVYAPGEMLSEPHLHEVGLAVADGGDLVPGSPIEIGPLVADGGVTDGGVAADAPASSLAGLKVVDFSAFVAGPLAAQVLADLGAEVIKVEPPEGEAMRAAAYAVAACQRGKRSVAIDLQSPAARPVVDALLAWADVVLHNFRPGVAERLGIDEATVARLNPTAVYCHASGFGTRGPRALFPGNDALMQALTGLERAVGGEGNEPLAPTWIPIDVAGGWVGAVGILAGLYAREVTGVGQRVATSLLGAGLLMQSGVFQRDGQLVSGPQLDAAQTGYGPGYRLYEAGDGEWFALVLPDEAAWVRLGLIVEGLPVEYAPLRVGPRAEVAVAAEPALEAAFRGAPAAEWVERLRAADLLVEPVAPISRDEFRRMVLDDPVNRSLGRVVEYDAFDWGRFEQIGPLVRIGPDTPAAAPAMLPGIGEHTAEVLCELGFTDDEVEALLLAGVVRQLAR